MKITIYGPTGKLGRECLGQCLEQGHDVTVLSRSPDKIERSTAKRIQIVEGDVLSYSDVNSSLPDDTEAILFAIGITGRSSPEDLCTKATENIIRCVRQKSSLKLIWCGGGSNLLDDDVKNFSSGFVRWYAERFMKKKHFDKEHQIALLEQNRDLKWVGIRPLQMVSGSLTTQYRLGYHAFSGMSKISFEDCAHAMVSMLTDDTWVGQIPIIQY